MDDSKAALAFIRRVRHDIEVKDVRKTLEKVIAKKLTQELAGLDLTDSIDQAQKLIEGNALKGDVKYDSLSLFISANTKSMAYILVVPKTGEEEDPSRGDIIKLGSRLLASCETPLLDPVKVARCILFFMDQCPEMIRNVKKLSIFTNDPFVQEYFDNRTHPQHFKQLTDIKHEWIQIPDGDNPAGFLLLTRRNIASTEAKEKISKLYALRYAIYCCIFFTI